VRRLVAVVGLSLVATACGQASVDVSDIPPLEATDPVAVRQILAGSDRPVVVNVWASWCGPCRSEAPLLRSAAAEHGDDVTFLGIDVRDSQDGARAFIAEFGLGGFTHLFDATGAIPNDLGGFGVPLTFFFHPGGELSLLHSGVIDERTLALQIDELLAGSG
jgi:cytochrome c biogenesis protein CcmG/thiol:disulfide interchange protein DsbE